MSAIRLGKGPPTNPQRAKFQRRARISRRAQAAPVDSVAWLEAYAARAVAQFGPGSEAVFHIRAICAELRELRAKTKTG